MGLIDAKYTELARAIFISHDLAKNPDIPCTPRPILGVDLATVKTGVTIYEPDTRAHSTSEIITKGEWPAKWGMLNNEFHNLMKRVEGDMPVVLVENMNYGAQNGREISGGVHALFQMNMWEVLDYNLVYVDITHIKMLATGSGSSKVTKAEVVEGLYQKYGVEFWHETRGKRVYDDNKADSYALARIGELIYRVARGEKVSLLDGRNSQIVTKTIDNYVETWGL